VDTEGDAYVGLCVAQSVCVTCAFACVKIQQLRICMTCVCVYSMDLKIEVCFLFCAHVIYMHVHVYMHLLHRSIMHTTLKFTERNEHAYMETRATIVRLESGR
jgi:hypothetical protein